jgi:two-component system sensor histidine kinase DegS
MAINRRQREAPMTEAPQAALSPRDELLDFLHQHYEKTKTQLRELQALIEQTHNEVERLQQRNALVTNRLHQVESNFDSVPRQDIRVAYNEAMDARSRLLTMRGNLEKLQGDQTQLERLAEVLTQLIGKLEGVSPSVLMAEATASANDGSPSATSIIRIIEAQENERKRLARQMHDGPAQSLTNFILQAEICQRLFDRNPDRAAEELNNLKTVASSTFQKVRDFIFDLRPMMLDDLGLIPTIRRYVEAYEEKSGIDTSLHILGDERRLEAHREVVMFRSIQELLGNARDHGKASKITITLDMGADTITCIVEDNGQGFSPEAVFASESDSAAPSENKALGLKTLRERVELIGGGLEVQSEEGKGAKITVRIPAGKPPSI